MPHQHHFMERYIMIDDIRIFIHKYGIIYLVYGAYLAMFFLIPHDWRKLYKNTFYIIMLISFLFLINKEFLIRLKNSKLFCACCVYLLYMCCTLIWGDNIPEFQEIKKPIYKALLLLSFLTITAALAYRNESFQQNIFRCISISALIGATLSIFMFYFYHNNTFDIRLIGIGRGHHSILSAVIYSSAIICIFFGLLPRVKNRHEKWLHISTLIFAAVFIQLTGSRGVILSFTTVFFLWLMLTSKLKTISIISCSLITYFILIYAEVIPPCEFIQRGLPYRPDIWQHWVLEIRDSFWLGSGITSIQPWVMDSNITFLHPHNIFIANHFTGGMPATILFTYLIYQAIRYSINIFKTTGNFTFTALLVFALICGIFDFSLLFLRPHDVCWFFFWFPIALIIGLDLKLDHTAQ